MLANSGQHLTNFRWRQERSKTKSFEDPVVAAIVEAARARVGAATGVDNVGVSATMREIAPTLSALIATLKGTLAEIAFIAAKRSGSRQRAAIAVKKDTWSGNVPKPVKGNRYSPEQGLSPS